MDLRLAIDSLHSADSAAETPQTDRDRPLSGKIITTGGEVHAGRIVYDLDEAETWEILDGDRRDVRYRVPFGLIAAIVPRGDDWSLVVLRGGEEIELEDTADVDEDNDGVLVLGGEEVDTIYVP